MKKDSFSVLSLTVLGVVAPLATAFATTVTGNAFKAGASDQSGITLQLFNDVTVPGIGSWGAAALVALMAVVMWRMNHRRAWKGLAVAAVLLFTGLAWASLEAVRTTDSNGVYTFTNISQGPYRLEVTAFGYQQVNVNPVVVLGGATQRLDDITLQPNPTPTP